MTAETVEHGVAQTVEEWKRLEEELLECDGEWSQLDSVDEAVSEL